MVYCKIIEAADQIKLNVQRLKGKNVSMAAFMFSKKFPKHGLKLAQRTHEIYISFLLDKTWLINSLQMCSLFFLRVSIQLPQ